MTSKTRTDAKAQIMRFRNVIVDEENAIQMLHDHRVILMSVNCTGKHVNTCSSEMCICKKRRVCTRKKCRKKLLMYHGCSLLSQYTIQLPMSSMLELLWLFLYAKSTVRNVRSATGRSHHTIVDWWGGFRSVCTYVVQSQHRMVGTQSSSSQVDKSFFPKIEKWTRKTEGLR